MKLYKFYSCCILVCLAFTACGEKLTERQLFSEAEKHEQAENYRQAIDAYEAQVESYPDSSRAATAQSRLATLYYSKIEDLNKANEAYKRVISNYKDSRYIAEAQLMVDFLESDGLEEAAFDPLASRLEEAGKIEEVIKLYEKQLEVYRSPVSAPKALQKLAFLHYNSMRDFHRAIKYHERIVNEFPESALVTQAYFMIGFIYANDIKDYDMAKKRYTEFLEKYPDDELTESVKWELKYLGQDVNEQLKDVFGTEASR